MLPKVHFSGNSSQLFTFFVEKKPWKLNVFLQNWTLLSDKTFPGLFSCWTRPKINAMYHVRWDTCFFYKRTVDVTKIAMEWREKIKQNADIKAFSFSSKPSKTKSAVFFGPRHWDNEATLPMNTMPACSSISSQPRLGFSVADRRRRYIEKTDRQFPYKDS